MNLQSFQVKFVCSVFMTIVFCGSPSLSLAEETSLNALISETPAADSLTVEQPGRPSGALSDEPYFESEEKLSSEEFVKKAWAASGQNDLSRATEITNECLSVYKAEADQLNSQLTDFPPQDKIDDYRVMNDVATCMFIQAEALMSNGKTEAAKSLFEKIIVQYKWAQAWDPRGWYWSVVKKSKASISIITGQPLEEELKAAKPVKKTMPNLYFKGRENIVDYTKYGQFIAAGTQDYHYKINDPVGLQKAVGEGIYPDAGSLVRKDPGYKKAVEEGRLEGSHWDFVHTEDLEAAFYKWATAPEPWGVKLFYLGLIFEKAKMYYEAIKTYHAIIVHFPNATGKTYWNTPWYPGQAAIAKIRHLVRVHPELEFDFKWAKIQVLNGFDNDVANDVVITFPGVITKKGFWDKLKERFHFDGKKVPLKKVKQKLGEGRVRLVQYDSDHWQLLVDDKPFVIKGITYAPTKVGQSPDKNTIQNWMTEDMNNNGRIDGPYDSWVDKNLNNTQDKDEPAIGDFRLIKDLGANTLRIYHQPFEPNKELLRRMHKEYGMMVIMGDFIGKYALGSGANWFDGTDYENPEHRRNMLESVKKMVLEFKDEPYVLMWLLGNENNYGVANNADKKPQAYYRFVNEVARLIKSIDKNHPVAICNGDTLFLDIFAKYALDVDVFAVNAYRGEYGFGSYWEQVFDATGKPAFISEFGCPAYANHMTSAEAEQAQADYHRGNWQDISLNMAGYVEGTGNSLGGVIFEWMDEWWKNYEPFVHDKTAGAIGPFPDGYMYEEWFGLCGQGDGKNSPFLRHLRKSYFLYKELLNKN